MQDIQLQAIQNQELSFQFEDENYTITLKAFNSIVVADIERNDDIVIQGQRVVPFVPIIPYRYLSTTGNLILQTEDNELPDFTKFNVSQFLVYATAEELNR